jgi:thiol-disulfide isomerase/thioredoxin
MNRWVGRALLIALGTLFALRVVQLGRAGMPRVSVPRGSQAPELAGALLSGDRFRLSDERGHPVVLAFWASWCGPCMGELPGVERVAEQLRQPPHTARLIAVNTEGNRAAAGDAARRLGLTMPIVLDDGSASAAYQVSSIPHTVIIDRAGKVTAVLHGAASEDELMRAIERVEKP